MGGRMGIGKRKLALSLPFSQHGSENMRLFFMDAFALSEQRLPQRGEQLIDALNIRLADTEAKEDAPKQHLTEFFRGSHRQQRDLLQLCLETPVMAIQPGHRDLFLTFEVE